MSRLYDKSFKIGFFSTIVVFAFFNTGSYLLARSEFLGIEKELEFIPLSGTTPFPSWGFPFSWFDERNFWYEDIILSLVMNVFAILGCSFVIGLISRSIGIGLVARVKI